MSYNQEATEAGEAFSVVQKTMRSALRTLHGAVDHRGEFIYPGRIEQVAALLGWEPAVLLRAQIESVSDASDGARLEFWDSFEEWFKASKNTHIAALFTSAAERFPEIDEVPDFDTLEALQ